MNVVVDLLGFERERHHEFRFQAIGLAGLVHTNYRIELAVHLDLSANDVAVGAEMNPKTIGKDHDMVFANLAFLRQKIAPQQERSTHHAVRSWRYRPPHNTFRLVRSLKVHGNAGPGDQILKRSVLTSPIEKVASRHCVVVAADFGPHHDQLIRVWIWHGRQQYGINHAEDRGDGPNAKRQSSYCHSGKAWISAQKACGKPKILADEMNCLPGPCSRHHATAEQP